ncbi:MAG: phosphate-selective porin OprO/OprP [Saprospiraceae bacterium]|jgi:phosphate-selective porin OprO/OprP
MYRILLAMISIIAFMCPSNAQIGPDTFGKGLEIRSKDSTLYMKFGFRFQSLATNEWTQNSSRATDHSAALLIRRSRLKWDGYAMGPKLKYKVELGISNRDIGGGAGPEFSGAARVILDAFVDWNFYKNFSLRVGQAKLPGNRERVISSANLQMVDRSRLNSRYNIDRDMGIQLRHNHNIGGDFIVREIFSISQGEGRDVTAGHFGGYDYTARVEFLPFGNFASKGDYVGGATKYEGKPKLSIGVVYDLNKRAARERGQGGDFIKDDSGYYGNDLKAFFADMMFKHKKFSIMGEYVSKITNTGSPFVYNTSDELVGTYFTGTGLNIQSGYMMSKTVEVSVRYTQINPDEGVSLDEKEYTLGLSKYIVGHKLKVQTDLSRRTTANGDDKTIFRVQMDIHF